MRKSRLGLILTLLLVLALAPAALAKKKKEDEKKKSTKQINLAGLIYTTATKNNTQMTGGYDPVVGVEVRIQGTDWVTTTTERGMFYFEGAPEGECTIVCSKDGWGTVTKKVNVTNGTFAENVRLVMNPAGTQMVGDTPTGPGTLYVAFAGRQVNQAEVGTRSGMPKNPHVYRSAIAAGADPLALETNGPPAQRMPGTYEWNPTNFAPNSLMILPPNNPTSTGFHNLTSSPFWVCFNKPGTILYVSNSNKQIQVFDAAHENRLISNIPARGVITDLQLSPNGEYVLAPIMAATPGVMMIETRTHTPQAFIPVQAPGGSQPRAVVMNPQGDRMYVVTGTLQSGEVTMIDVYSGQALGTAQVGANPTGVAISPDGRFLYVPNASSGTLTVLDAWSLTAAGDIGVGVNPQKVAVAPNGARIFVTNKGSNSVSIIDGRSHQVLASIPVSKGPLGVAVALDSSKAFVTCKDSGTVVTINAATGALEHTTDPMPNSSPFGLAVRP
ncbi:MAG: beta-propeller fold lactonase family protein [Vulcanimicrobiota bacterium]